VPVPLNISKVVYCLLLQLGTCDIVSSHNYVLGLCAVHTIIITKSMFSFSACEFFTGDCFLAGQSLQTCVDGIVSCIMTELAPQCSQLSSGAIAS
jgi:hypothetical protein